MLFSFFCYPFEYKSVVNSLHFYNFSGCRKVMLRVDAKQGASREGNSPLELFQVTSFLGFLLSRLLLTIF
jgi:hypothetical protein